LSCASPANTVISSHANSYLNIGDRVPYVNEKIYIPQHAGARDKEFGIFDTENGSGERCSVKSGDGSCKGGGAYDDIRYTCDTEGGSSGSPVMSVETNKVVALHHCRDACTRGNRGVPMAQIYPEVAGLIYGPPTPPPTPPSCTDDTNWRYRHGNKYRSCNDLAGNSKFCGREGTDGKTGFEACGCSC
jgi:hypothetical protein